MIRQIHFLTTIILAASLSANGQESTNERAISLELKDFDGAVYEVENNYAGFSSKTSDPARHEEYVNLKDKLYKDVLNGRNGADAVGELYGWFGDNHLRTILAEHGKYRKTRHEYVSAAEGMSEYDPQAVAQKVGDETFLIRFTSCAGDPSLKWINESVEAYKQSQCRYLILDIRGNGGGSDMYYKPYLRLLFDREFLSRGVEVRNSTDNIAYMLTQVERLPWVQKVVDRAANSDDEFIPLVDDFVIKYDTINALPVKAAIIIDSKVASSAEQLVLDIKGCSSRTVVYGKSNTLGCLDYSNLRRADLRGSGITTYVPMTRSNRLPENGIDDTGIAPDVRISLPLPATLTDNVDEWVLWVANNLKNRR